MLSFKDNAESIQRHFEQFAECLKSAQAKDSSISVYEVAKSYVDNEISMENGMGEYHNYLLEVRAKDERLMKAIKSVKGKTFYKYLIELMEDKVDYATMEIVATPTGDFQSSSDFGRTIKGYWVDQTTNGGMSGDSYAGTICVQIKENKFLKWQYSC